MMNWLKKIVSALENDWWRNIEFHLEQTVPYLFPTVDWRQTQLTESDTNIYCPQPFQVIVRFRQELMEVTFALISKNNVYACYAMFVFDDNIMRRMTPNPWAANEEDKKVHMQRWIKNIPSNPTTCICHVVKTGKPGVPFLGMKYIGQVENPMEGMSPYEIVQICKTMIENDKDIDDGNSEDEIVDPQPYSPAKSPVLVGV